MKFTLTDKQVFFLLQAMFEHAACPDPPKRNRHFPTGDRINLGVFGTREHWILVESVDANERRIWFVRDNSHDNDSWMHCNVDGGIGKCVPYSETLNKVVRDIGSQLARRS